MADSKISDLAALTGVNVATDDVLPIVDTSATTAGSKKITIAELYNYLATVLQPIASALTSWAGVTRASGFDTFTATPSSANLRSLLTDETGTGAAVFATSPAITTPTLTDPVITGAIAEDVYQITDGAAFEIDPGNGTVQYITLGDNRIPKGTNFANGESVTLHVDDGSARTIDWTDSTFGTGGVKWVGGSAPTLPTSGYGVIVLWKFANQVYGKSVGDVA